jgi:hypothetical protein
MKRYKRYFKEEDSLKDLTDESIPQKLVDFIKKNPFPQDHEGIHKFAEEELKIDADILEQYCYAFLTLIFCGGASKGKEVDASKENMDIGHKIEIEHCSYDTDNKVIKAMQDIIVNKIANDHLAETDSYYVDGVKSFKDELKQEGK